MTGLWNYAQHFAMSDNIVRHHLRAVDPGSAQRDRGADLRRDLRPSFAVINASTCTAPRGLDTTNPVKSNIKAGRRKPAGTGTTYSDADPTYDICSYLPSSDGGDGGTPADTITMGGNNIGVSLTKARVTWGWFQGGFDDGSCPVRARPRPPRRSAPRHTTTWAASAVTDYSPHHEPFEYYASTANPITSRRPRSPRSATPTRPTTSTTSPTSGRGQRGPPAAVSYLKAPKYQDAHAGYYDPLDEQTWLVSTINQLQSLPTWRSTAVVITYDDSDGCYDHVLGPLITQSRPRWTRSPARAPAARSSAQVPVNWRASPSRAGAASARGCRSW